MRKLLICTILFIFIALGTSTAYADFWVNASSTNYDSHCGDSNGSLELVDALDDTQYWQHSPNEVHWFILDFGTSLNVKRWRARSNTSMDPTDIDVYVSDIKGTWGTAVSTGTSLSASSTYVTVDSTDKQGRYVYVVINSTEHAFNWNSFGQSTGYSDGLPIFDVETEAPPSLPARTNYTQDANCQAVWLFAEGTGGVVADASQNTNTGTFSNVTWSAASLPKPYMASSGVFNGTTAQINCNSNGSLDDMSPVTCVVWSYPDTPGENNIGTFYNKVDVGETYFRLRDADHKLEFDRDHVDGDLFVVTAASQYVEDQWQHFAVTWDGTVNATGVHIYVDGEEVSSYGTQTDGSGAIKTDADGNLYIGNRNGQVRHFDGNMAEFALFDRVLTQNEIQAIIARGLQGSPTLFNSGFETGDLSEWDSYSNSNDTMVASTNAEYADTYGALVTLASSPGYAYVEKEVTGYAHGEIYIRFFIKFVEDDWQYVQSSESVLLECLNLFDATLAELKLFYSSSNYYLYLTQKTDGSDVNRPGSQASGWNANSLVDGRWHSIEYHFKAGTGANGIIELFVDGTDVANGTDAYDMDEQHFSKLRLGIIGTDTNDDGEFYIDDVRVGDTAPLGAGALPKEDWLYINSTHFDSACSAASGWEDILDDAGALTHSANEVHWLIVDLGKDYLVTKVRGRSDHIGDPDDVDIYVSKDKTNWGEAVYTAGSFLPATFVELDTTDKVGRYVKMEINSTEHVTDWLYWSDGGSWFGDGLSSFDVQGREAGQEFVCSIRSDGQPADYSSLVSWQSAIQCDLTSAVTAEWTTQVGSDIADGTTVSWFGGTGTLKHMTTVAKSGANTFLIVPVSGDSLEDSDLVSDGENSFIVSGVPVSVTAVAKIAGTWASAETSNIDIDGWTTSVANYIKIYATGDAFHKGLKGSSAYWIDPASDGHAITVNEDYTYIEGLRVTGVTGESSEGFRVYGDYTTISKCLIHDIGQDNGNSDAIYIGSNGLTLYVLNNIFYDISRSAVMFQNVQNATAYVYNCTAYNCMNMSTYTDYCVIGFDRNATRSNAGSLCVVKNTIAHAYNNNRPCFQSVSLGTPAQDGDYTGSDYNICNDTSNTEVGTNSLGSRTFNDNEDATSGNYVIFSSVTANSENLHLYNTAENDAIDFAPSLSTDDNLPFSDDIDGTTRPIGSGWEASADEADATAATIVDATLYDTDNNGYIDEILIEFSENMDDSSITNADASQFEFDSIDCTDVDDATDSSSGSSPSNPDDPQIANDQYITIFTNESVFGTGLDNELTFVGAADEYEDLNGNDTASDSTITEVDEAAPILVRVYIADAGPTAGVCNDPGDRMDLIFSEGLSALPSAADLDDAIEVDSAAGDHIPTNGTDGTYALATTTFSNDTIRIIFGTTGNGWVAPATAIAAGDSVEVSDGSDLTDGASNTANTSAASQEAGRALVDTEVVLHIGDNRGNVNITGVTGYRDAWVVQCAAADLSDIRVGDCLADEAADVARWRIIAVDNSADTITVSYELPSQYTWASSGTGPSFAGSTQAWAGAWYTTLSSWESDRDGDITATGRNTRETAACYNDWAGGLDNTLWVSGSTTDSSHYFKITSPAGQRHNGIAGTGFHLKPTTNQNASAIGIDQAYTVVEWLEISNWTGYSGWNVRYAIEAALVNGLVTIRNNIVHDNGTDSRNEQHGIRINRNNYIYNNIVYNISGRGIYEISGYSTNLQIYSNTVYNYNTRNGGFYGISFGSDTDGNCKNNIVIAGTNGGNCFGFSGITHDYNASSDATANGSNALNSGSPTVPSTSYFVSTTASSEDLHLQSTADCIGKGTSVSYAYDIDNDERPLATTWDMGADEYAATPTFTDYTATAGVGNTGGAYAISWEDFNNDGHIDLFIGGVGQMYYNDGDGTFSIWGGSGYGDRAAIWFDADNAGDMDLFASLNGIFYQNEGDGADFTERAAAANLVGSNLGTTAALDYNKDGFIDVFFANGDTVYNEMRVNNGNGSDCTFTTIDGSAIGLNTGEDNGETTAVADIDNDGDIDIYYNASAAARLYFNDGDGTFTEGAAGANISRTGSSYAGAAFGDYNNDGWLDFYSNQDTGNESMLYLNAKDGTFTRQGSAACDADLGDTTGVAWGDYDNDGDLDLLLGNDGSANYLFRNDGGGAWTDVAGTLGIQNGTLESHSVSFADYDNDGDLDIYYNNSSAANALYRNNLDNDNYLKVKVVGAGRGNSPRDGIGTRIELWNSDESSLLAIREVSGGEGYGNFPSRIQHFGLASNWGGPSGSYVVKAKFTSGIVATRASVIPENESITIDVETLTNTIEIREEDFGATAILQQGVDGYLGCEDTWLWDDNATTNYGDSDVMIVKWAGADYNRTGLIRWDISSIPDSATITSVRMDLVYAGSGNNPGTTYLYDCLRDWGEMSATWNTYDGSNGWSAVGARGTDSDTDGTPGTSTGDLQSSPVYAADAAGDPKVFSSNGAMITSVEDALSGGSLNWIMHQGTSNDANCTYATSENALAWARPILTISYAEPTAEFVVTVKESGGDYDNLEEALNVGECDLTAVTTKVFSHAGKNGSLAVNDVVCGAYSNATGTIRGITSSQILLENITGAFSFGEQVYETLNTNYVIIEDAGKSPIYTVKIDGTWSAADSGRIIISGWTTSSANYINIYTTEAARHDGAWDTGAYIIEHSTVFEHVVDVQSDYVKMTGIQIKKTSGNGGARALQTSGDFLEFDKMIVNAGNNRCVRLEHNNGNPIILTNSVFLSSDSDDSTFVTYGKAYLYNCVSINTSSAPAFSAAENWMYLTNCYAYSASGTSINGSLVVTATSASDDGAESTSTVAYSTSSGAYFTNVTNGSEDFHLSSNSSSLYDAGTDLSGIFADDIDGDPRISWDIGADESDYQPNIWTDADGGDSNWSTAGNWDRGVPLATQSVIFNSSYNTACTADSVNIGIDSITIESGYTSTVTFETNAVNGGMVLDLPGDFTFTGAGHVVFECDTSTDSIPGGVNDGTGYTVNAENITIADGAHMHSDSLGFAPGAGPGTPSGQNSASYGGMGSGGEDTYGSVTDPTSLGSGGSVGSGDSEGGGAITLNVNDTLTIDGSLTAVGGLGDYGRVGSGGSINISADTLTGASTGEINVRGGYSNNSLGRYNGGGGRISLYNVNNWSYSGEILAGETHGEYHGHAGTIAFPDDFDLVVGGAGNPSDILMGTDSTPYPYNFNSITINSGGTLEIGGNPELNVVDGTAQGSAAAINVATNVTINNGGFFGAEDRGFSASNGPGAAWTNQTGAHHGGYGTAPENDVYGSVLNPISLGSGGQAGSADTAGGGAIILDVTGTITVNGTLSARGLTGAFDRDGAGGSINITCDTLGGTTGTINASGGGGGGRVKIAYSTMTYAGSIYAYGGESDCSAGTIVLRDTDTQTYGDLIIEDNDYGSKVIPIPWENFTGTPRTLTLDSITIDDDAMVVIPGGNILAAIGDINIGSSGDSGDTARIIAESIEPAAHWKLNDNAATTVVVDTMGNYDGTSANNTDTMDITGNVNGGLQFEDTANDTVSFPTTVPAEDLFSLVFWMKASAPSDFSEIFTKFDTNGFRIQFNDTAGSSRSIYMRLDTSAGGNQTKAGIADTCDDAWHMYVYIVDNGTIKYSKDAAALSSDTYSPGDGLENSAANFHMNRWVNTDFSLDNVLIYDYTLNQDQIEHLYNSGTGTEASLGLGVKITADNINIYGSGGDGARINAFAQGYDYDEGPGAGGTDGSSGYGAGGGYGGAGGASSDGSTAGSTYGSATDPLDLGSGGGTTGGGAGGGALLFDITDTLTVVGFISVDGGDGSSDGGGGSGGSIKGTVDTLAGAGIIRADGGDGAGATGGGGGGGRIYFDCSTDNFSSGGTLQALGGSGGSSSNGTASIVEVDTDPPTNVGCSTPSGSASNQSLTPTLTALTAADSGSGLHATPYYIEIDTATTFDSGNLQQSGWQAGTAWIPTTELSVNTTYYWRVKARDAEENESASCGHTADAAGYGSFTTTQAPTAPTTLYSNDTDAQSGTNNPTNLGSANPHFSALYNDPDTSDTAVNYRIQVDNDQDFSSPVWDGSDFGQFFWAKRLGGTSSDYGIRITSDANNNIIVTGFVTGNADMNGDGDSVDGGAESATGYGSSDVFISVFNSSGTWQWAKRLGGTGADIGGSITTDNNNNIIIIGHVAGNADMNGDGDSTDGGAESATGYGSHDVFISVFNSSGIWQWAKRLGGDAEDCGQGITTDANNNIIVTGYVEYNVDINGDGDFTDGGAESAGDCEGEDVFISVFNSSGTWQWAKRLGGVFYDAGHSITTDA
ncbi:LamG-like jellyroll fold domain-containing protein, partial [Neptuniibacter sp.]|uniref:FG-GAP-like repeat-containing protein n=1 Tax=Neptuniibacter sp. TaxID=1962643 RepID=UPI0026142B92